MRVLGIDPSYSRSGIVVLDSEQGVIASDSISVPQVVKKGSIYQFSVSFPAAVWHARECLSWLESQDVGRLDAVFIEYPALSSAMGAWLLPLQCMLYDVMGCESMEAVPFYLLPPTAINSYVLPKKPKLKKGEIPTELWVKPTGKVAKQMIVDWVGREYGLECDHDVASAVVLAHLGVGILDGSITHIKHQLVDRWYSLGEGVVL